MLLLGRHRRMRHGCQGNAKGKRKTESVHLIIAVLLFLQRQVHFDFVLKLRLACEFGRRLCLPFHLVPSHYSPGMLRAHPLATANDWGDRPGLAADPPSSNDNNHTWALLPRPSTAVPSGQTGPSSSSSSLTSSSTLPVPLRYQPAMSFASVDPHRPQLGNGDRSTVPWLIASVQLPLPTSIQRMVSNFLLYTDFHVDPFSLPAEHLRNFQDLFALSVGERKHATLGFYDFELAYGYGKRIAQRFGFMIRIKTTASNKGDGIIYKYMCCRRAGNTELQREKRSRRKFQLQAKKQLQLALAAEAAAEDKDRVGDVGTGGGAAGAQFIANRPATSNMNMINGWNDSLPSISEVPPGYNLPPDMGMGMESTMTRKICRATNYRCDCLWVCRLLGVMLEYDCNRDTMEQYQSDKRPILWFWAKAERPHAHNHPLDDWDGLSGAPVISAASSAVSQPSYHADTMQAPVPFANRPPMNSMNPVGAGNAGHEGSRMQPEPMQSSSYSSMYPQQQHYQIQQQLQQQQHIPHFQQQPPQLRQPHISSLQRYPTPHYQQPLQQQQVQQQAQQQRMLYPGYSAYSPAAPGYGDMYERQQGPSVVPKQRQHPYQRTKANLPRASFSYPSLSNSVASQQQQPQEYYRPGQGQGPVQQTQQQHPQYFQQQQQQNPPFPMLPNPMNNNNLTMTQSHGGYTRPIHQSMPTMSQSQRGGNMGGMPSVSATQSLEMQAQQRGQRYPYYREEQASRPATASVMQPPLYLPNPVPSYEPLDREAPASSANTIPTLKHFPSEGFAVEEEQDFATDTARPREQPHVDLAMLAQIAHQAHPSASHEL